MKYQIPELNPVPAIQAIQNSLSSKDVRKRFEGFIQPGSPFGNEISSGYADWE